MNDEVEAMDDGLDTLIGERGTKLPEGQRQQDASGTRHPL